MKKYPYHQSPFYKCTTKRKLYGILNVEIKDIEGIVKRLDNSEAYFWFRDKNGRNIMSPYKKLKSVQKRINHLLSRIEIPVWVHGGIKKRSIQTNATTHKNSNIFLQIDIKKFYNNCSREKVFQFFYSKLSMSPDVAKIMTDLTTYQNQLVTGSPSSSYLSFLAYEEMFIKINDLVTEKGMIMTLYVDDITISGFERIENLHLFIDQIDKILKKSGHQINNRKTSYLTANDHPIITGISISPSGKIKVPNSLRHNIINALSDIKKGNKEIILSTKGRIIHAQQTEKNIFQNTLNNLKHYEN